MTRGTTPSITITTDTDLTALDVVVITIEDERGHKIDVIPGEVTSASITAVLTQEQTLALENGLVDIQVRAATADGKMAIASQVMRGYLGRVLKDGVINAQIEVS